MPFTPRYAIFYAIYPNLCYLLCHIPCSSSIFFLNVMLQYITVMLCFLGKVEGISRGIAVLVGFLALIVSSLYNIQLNVILHTLSIRARKISKQVFVGKLLDSKHVLNAKWATFIFSKERQDMLLMASPCQGSKTFWRCTYMKFYKATMLQEKL